MRRGVRRRVEVEGEVLWAMREVRLRKMKVSAR